MNKNIAMATLRLFKAFPKAETVDAKNIEEEAKKPANRVENTISNSVENNTIENAVSENVVLNAVLGE